MALTQQVATKALIRNKDGDILLLQRSKPYHGETDLKWDLPGGRIDPGEPLETALRRELREETAMELTKLGPVYYLQDFIIEPQQIHVVRITFSATAAGEIALSDEHVAYRWVPKSEIAPETTAYQLIDALRANE